MQERERVSPRRRHRRVSLYVKEADAGTWDRARALAAHLSLSLSELVSLKLRGANLPRRSTKGGTERARERTRLRLAVSRLQQTHCESPDPEYRAAQLAALEYARRVIEGEDTSGIEGAWWPGDSEEDW